MICIFFQRIGKVPERTQPGSSSCCHFVLVARSPRTFHSKTSPKFHNLPFRQKFGGVGWWSFVITANLLSESLQKFYLNVRKHAHYPQRKFERTFQSCWWGKEGERLNSQASPVCPVRYESTSQGFPRVAETPGKTLQSWCRLGRWNFRSTSSLQQQVRDSRMWTHTEEYLNDQRSTTSECCWIPEKQRTCINFRLFLSRY